MARIEYTSPDLLLTTSGVATLLDVHPSTAKRWCESGELASQRTKGGHRRIHLDHALALAERRGIPSYLSPFAPYERHVFAAMEDIVRHDRYDRLHSLSMGWLVRGRAKRVGALLAALATRGGVPFPRYFDRAIRDFMRQVGEAWREGRLSIGEEHLITQAVTEAVLRVDRSLAKDNDHHDGASPRPVAIVGSMEGNLHHLGALCVRVLLERIGWEVAYLGPDMPVDELASVQRTMKARLVCVSFTPPQVAADMTRCAGVLREFYRTDTPYAVALGGAMAHGGVFAGDAWPFLATGVFDGCEGFGRWIDETGAKCMDAVDSRAYPAGARQPS